MTQKYPIRILVVDDNLVNQKLAHTILTKGGYQVELASNGLEAVEKFTTSAEEFDLILMDIQMPTMGGLEATRIIRGKGFDSIPIIALTTHALESDRIICMEAGMNDHIAKPVHRENLYFLIDKYVRSCT